MSELNPVWKWITGGIGYLLSGLKNAAAGMVGKVLSTFGLTMVTFQSLLPNLKDFVTQYTDLLPADVMNFLGAIGLGQAMSMILSALMVRMAWKVFVIPTSVADTMGTP